MSSPKPFIIDIPQSKIDNLRQKLALAEFPDDLEEAGWDIGCPLEDIKRLVRAWEQWDWRQAEKKLNEHPQFQTDIQVEGFGSLNIHFVHQKSEVNGAIPLLFVHGCKRVDLTNHLINDQVSQPFFRYRRDLEITASECRTQGPVLSSKC